MKAGRISEMSVHSNDITRHYSPEDYKLHCRRRDNLKSHTVMKLGGNLFYFKSADTIRQLLVVLQICAMKMLK
jgi:hypothetical protein